MNLYDEIITNISPLEVAQRYLNLRKSGRNYMAVCPFHADTKPSLSFDPERGLFYCFGCGKSGNLIHLIAEIEGISSSEALKELCNIAGIEIKEKKEKREDEKIYDIMEFALNEYHKILFESMGEKARNFLNEKNFKLHTIRRFKIGYAPPDGDFIIKKAREKGINPSLLLEAGLITGTSGTLRDFFRDRLIFPIYSVSGKCVAFGGRAFEGEPKYLNSPETKIFKKSKNLFGLNIAKNEARRKGTLILVEGYTDVLRMVESGFENTVAPLGTAFSTDQALIIRRFAGNIIVLFDGDDAGKRGMKRALPFLLKADLKVKIGMLPENEDPESFLKKNEKEKMEEILNNSKDFIDAFLPEKLPDDPYAQSLLLSELTNFISCVPSEIERELFIKKLSKIFLISSEYIKSRVKPTIQDSKIETGDFIPDYSVFGTIVAFNYFKKEEFEKRKIDERVFKDTLLRNITKRILKGEIFEEILFELPDKERRKLMEAIFKAKEKFKNVEFKDEKDSPPLSAFKYLEDKMSQILREEEILEKWREMKNKQGSIPIQRENFS